jgi:hypothetical protein
MACHWDNMILSGRLVGFIFEGVCSGKLKNWLSWFLPGEKHGYTAVTYIRRKIPPRFGHPGRSNHSPHTSGVPFRVRMDFGHGEKKAPPTFQAQGCIHGQIFGSAYILLQFCHLERLVTWCPTPKRNIDPVHIMTYISDGAADR